MFARQFSFRSGHRQSLRWLRISIIAFYLAILFGYGIDTYRHITHERDDIISNATERAAALVVSLEEHLVRTVQAVDLVFASASDKLDAQLRTEKPNFAALGHALYELHWRAPQVRNLLYVDREGKVAAASAIADAVGLDVSQREYFLAHLNNLSSESAVHAPFVDRVDGQLFLPLSQRVEGPGGGFAGVLVAGLETEYLKKFYTRILGPLPVTLSVYWQDGLQLVRIPEHEGAAGADMSRDPLFAALTEEPSAVRRFVADEFGSDRQVVYRKVAALPYVIAASMSEEVLLADWSNQAGNAVRQAVLVFIALSGLTGFLVAMTIRRERLARSLSESEERFRDFAAAASDWYWEMDSELRFSHVSGKISDMLGVDPASLLGRTREEIADQSGITQHWAGHLDDLANRRPFRDFVYKALMPNGRVAHCKISGKPIFAADGTFAGYRGTGADITRQILADESRRAQEVLLQDAIEALPDGFVLYDADDRFVMCNSKFRDLRAGNPISFQPGARFEDILRQALVMREFELAPDQDPEAWIRKRLEDRRDPAGHRISLSNGRWLRVSERRTRDGGMAAIHVDITELKTAQADAESARARMADWAEASSDWFWETNRNHRFRFMADRNNPDGSTSMALLGLSLRDLACDTQSEPEKWAQHFDQMERREPFRDFAFRISTGEDRIRVMSVSGKPIFDADGGFSGYRGTARDVTNEVLAKENAARAQRMLTAALEATEEGFTIWDADDRLVLCNGPFQRLHGAVADLYVPGAKFADIVHSAVARGTVLSARGREEAMIAERLTAHRQDKATFESRLDNGRWKRVKEYRMADGGVVGVHIDITDQKMREIELGELARRNALFFAAVSRATSAMVIADAKMAGQPVIYANPAFTSLTGYTEDDAIGQGADFFYDAEEAPEVITAVREAIAAHRPVEAMVAARHKDGRRIYLDLRAGPVESRDGQVTHFVFVQDDVTKRVEAEAHRATLENQLRHSQKIEALGTLAGGIAHDINNTLLPIMVLSKMTLKALPEDSAQREPMQTILDASFRVRDLVAGILAFSRKDMPKTDRVHLQQTVNKAVRLLTATLTPNISLIQTLGPDVRPISADENQLVQVLMNLCTNASHAIGANAGRIVIALDEVAINDAAGAHPSGLPHGAYVRLTVTDNGCGMDARTVQRIFEPFYTTKGVGEGTGLGLSVVHGIIANHHGRITVESELGQGTSFTILLPVAAEMSRACGAEIPAEHLDAI